MTDYDGLYNKNYFGEKLFENHFSNKELGFKVIENGTILPLTFKSGETNFGGIVDDDGIFIDRSSIHAGLGEAYFPGEEILQSSKTVIYMGNMTNIWGHCLTDNLKRIWFLKSKIFQENFRNCPLVYLNSYTKFIPNLLRLFEILEVDVDNWLEVKTPTRFKKIILPDESFWIEKSKTKNYDFTFEGNDCSFFTEEYFQMIDEIKCFAKKNFIPLSQKKFYFYHGKNQVGEQYLADYFSTKGYQQIKPENFSLDEQLNILTNCKNFASVIGSISHNIIFMRDHTQAILIPRRSAFLNIYQQALNQIHEMQIFYIDSAFSIYAEDWSGKFFYIVSEQLRKFFGDDVTEKFSAQDFCNFFTYAKYAKQEEFEINPQEERYLGDMIPHFMQCMKKFF